MVVSFFYRGFLVVSRLHSPSVLRRRGLVHRRHDKGPLHSGCLHAQGVRVPRYFLGLFFHFRVRHENHVIRGRGQEPRHRYSYRKGSLFLSTKGACTALSSRHVVSFQRL